MQVGELIVAMIEGYEEDYECEEIETDDFLYGLDL